MRERTPLQRWIYHRIQSLVLGIPRISEFRSSSAKAMAFLKAWHYLYQAQLDGDYYEFGVYEGSSFILSLRAAAQYRPKGRPESPRFFAFDSFQGLPSNHPTRDSGVFEEGSFSAGVDLFKRNIRSAAKGWEVGIIPGFYNESLNPRVIETHGLKPAAFVAIDCDLYESTRDVLRFMTPLVKTGTVIYFDDWFFSGGDMTKGEPGACADWLKENPSIQLVDYGNVGIMAKLFIVNVRSQA